MLVPDPLHLPNGSDVSSGLAATVATFLAEELAIINRQRCAIGWIAQRVWDDVVHLVGLLAEN
jgi:hypothetical protein